MDVKICRFLYALVFTFIMIIYLEIINFFFFFRILRFYEFDSRYEEIYKCSVAFQILKI